MSTLYLLLLCLSIGAPLRAYQFLADLRDHMTTQLPGLAPDDGSHASGVSNAGASLPFRPA